MNNKEILLKHLKIAFQDATPEYHELQFKENSVVAAALAAMEEVSGSKWIKLTHDAYPKLKGNDRSESFLAAAKFSTGVANEYEYSVLREYVYYQNHKWLWESDGTEIINEITHIMQLPSPPIQNQ